MRWYLLLILVFVAACSPFGKAVSYTTIPQGYAPPWDVYNNNLPIISITPEVVDLGLDQQSFLLSVNMTQRGGFVFKTFYIYTKSGWRAFDLQGTRVTPSFLNGSGINTRVKLYRSDIDAGLNYVIGISCKVQTDNNGIKRMKCGCSQDKSKCNMWMIQTFDVKKDTIAISGSKPSDLYDAFSAVFPWGYVTVPNKESVLVPSVNFTNDAALIRTITNNRPYLSMVKGNDEVGLDLELKGLNCPAESSTCFGDYNLDPIKFESEGIYSFSMAIGDFSRLYDYNSKVYVLSDDEVSKLFPVVSTWSLKNWSGYYTSDILNFLADYRAPNKAERITLQISKYPSNRLLNLLNDRTTSWSVMRINGTDAPQSVYIYKSLDNRNLIFAWSSGVNEIYLSVNSTAAISNNNIADSLLSWLLQKYPSNVVYSCEEQITGGVSSIRYKMNTEREYTSTDSCSDDTNLTHYVCTENGLQDDEQVECEFGCSQGKCAGELGEPTRLLGESCDTENVCVSPFMCYRGYCSGSNSDCPTNYRRVGTTNVFSCGGLAIDDTASTPGESVSGGMPCTFPSCKHIIPEASAANLASIDTIAVPDPVALSYFNLNGVSVCGDNKCSQGELVLCPSDCTAAAASQLLPVCGSAAGVPSTTQPATGTLCSTGSFVQSSMSGNNNVWSWSCILQSNANTRTCTAPKTSVVGVCAQNIPPSSTEPTGTLCTSGTRGVITSDASSWKWNCDSTLCSSVKTTTTGSGTCANLAASVSQPAPNTLCTSGTPSVQASDAAFWHWTCGGTSCSSKKRVCIDSDAGTDPDSGNNPEVGGFVIVKEGNDEVARSVDACNAAATKVTEYYCDTATQSILAAPMAVCSKGCVPGDASGAFCMSMEGATFNYCNEAMGFTCPSGKSCVNFACV